jgi:hypothetical protein
LARPTKISYAKCSKTKLQPDLKVENITNIKQLNTPVNVNTLKNELMHPHKIICDKILKDIIMIDALKFLKFRDYLYDIFIYNLDITDCIWYIIETLIVQGSIKRKDISNPRSHSMDGK